MQLSTGELIAIMAATFGATTTVVGLLVRQLLKSYRDGSRQELKSVRDACVSDVKQISERIVAVANERRACEEREDREIQRISDHVDRLRDKWERFIKDDAAMEATRGRKVEALFGVVDSVKETVRGLPEAMNRKMDEMYRDMRKEIRNDVRDEARAVQKRIGAANGPGGE